MSNRFNVFARDKVWSCGGISFEHFDESFNLIRVSIVNLEGASVVREVRGDKY